MEVPLPQGYRVDTTAMAPNYAAVAAAEWLIGLSSAVWGTLPQTPSIAPS
jgi:hypothetical protein